MPNIREGSAPSTRRIRPFALVATVCLGALGLGVSAAQGATTTLPGGTPLSVTIATPTQNQVVPNPPGTVNLTGTASIGMGQAQANTTIIYVVDVSTSTTDVPGDGCGGDQDSDGKISTILDCEIASARALNQKAITAGTVDESGVIFFSQNATTQDVNPALAGTQGLAHPNADTNNGGGKDIEEALLKATDSEGTNFEAASQRACQLVQQTTNPNVIVVFMSDGSATVGGSALDDVPCVGKTATFQTFAVGQTGSCTNTGLANQGSLQQIAAETGGTCTRVFDAATLPSIIPAVIATELTKLELRIDGGFATNISANATPPLPQPGPITVNYQRLISGLTVPGPHTICVRAFGKDSGGTGSIQECRTVIVQAAATPSTISIGNATIQEGSSGGCTTPATFKVTLDKPSTSPVTVNYTTVNGTATAGSDYVAKSGSVTFAPGETSKNIVVFVCGDTIDEPDETFTVVLSNPVGATILDGSGLGTIIDDERNGRFSCRASALNLLGLIEPVVANRPKDPCRDDSATLISATLSVTGLLVRADALNARTDQTPNNLAASPPAVGDNATAHADTATAFISLGITAEVTEANATARCTSSGVPTFSTSGQVVGLRVNGQTYNVLTGPVTINLLLATLRINHTSVSSNGREVRRRAIWLDNALLPDVIISEAIADYSGNPCDS